MKIKQLSLRIRIFLAMILLILLASILIAAVTIYQYKEQTDEYNQGRLERKEEAVKASINYWLNSGNGNTFPVVEENLEYIFREKIYEISDIEKLEINIYNLSGDIAKTSHSGFVQSSTPTKLNDTILKYVRNKIDHRFVNTNTEQGKSLQSSYSYITDNKFKPIGILNLQYVQDNTAQDKDLEEFLLRMAYVYILMFLLAIGLAYFISSYITRNIKAITDKIKQTRLNTSNEKITLKNPSSEIFTLVNAYNNMVDELEKSAVKLAKGEREQAWREMAKQVAHEIKNPLTPMKLNVQYLKRLYKDIPQEEFEERLSKISSSLIEQIDTLSNIATEFSNFARMPDPILEEVDMLSVIGNCEQLYSDKEEVKINIENVAQNTKVKADKDQMLRVFNNLVKNAIQAIPDQQNSKSIVVRVEQNQKNVLITVKDNGIGIKEMDKNRIFEPKFTTKSSGMGLGLAIIKNIIENYNGTITFNSELGNGTEFIVSFPITK